jgi:hypothetical protein
MKKYAILFLALIPFVAHAFDFYLEPSLGYQLWGNQTQTVANTDYEWSYRAPELGLKAGLAGMGLAGGLTVIQTLTYEKKVEKPSNLTGKDDLSTRHLGVFASFRFPFLLKLWASYYFISDYKYKNGANKDKSLKGNGFAVGAGYGLFPLVDLNLEFRDVTLNKFNGVKLNDEVAARELVFSVSVPLSL